jgi:alkane 1-monooxygenase
MAANAPVWRDPKRYAWLLALLIPLSPFLGAAIARGLDAPAGWYAGVAIAFGLIPLLDTWLGDDVANPPESVLARLEEDRYYRWCTMAFLPLQYAGLVFACAQWSAGALSPAAALGLALTVGIVGGFAINAAHELGHRKDTVERWGSRIALAQCAYGHFYVEHNRGHHVHVATPDDPASARYGESFYAFWPRTVWGSLRSALAMERARLARLGRAPWSLANEVVVGWAMTAVLFGGLVLAFGLRIAPWLLLQAVVGFTLLELVNYLEHYGLLRQRLPDGRTERCRHAHSWDSDRIASSLFLFHLQRHSDHHTHPGRRYQALRHVDDSPRLPHGYAAMVLLALVPPLWRRVMDPRLLAHVGGDLGRVNRGYVRHASAPQAGTVP